MTMPASDILASRTLARGALVAGIALAVSLQVAAAEIPERYLQRSRVERHALIIGVDTYDAITPVPSVAKDLKRIEEALRGQGFMQQATLVNPTYCETLAEVVAFGRRVRASAPDGNAIALVYFAGHGLHHGHEQWLAPRDFPDALPIALLTSAVPVSFVTDALEGSGAGGPLLMIDACRNDPLPPGPPRSGVAIASAASAEGCVVDPPDAIDGASSVFDPIGDPASLQPGSAPERASATYQCYSTRLGQLSNSPANGMSPSAYVDAIVEEIATPGIGAAEWMRNVRTLVEQRTGGTLKPMCEDHGAPLYSINLSDLSTEAAVLDWRRALGADICQIRKLVRNRPVSPVRAGMLAWLEDHEDALQQCAQQAGTFPLLLSQVFGDDGEVLTGIEAAASTRVLASRIPGSRIIWHAKANQVFRTITPLSERWASVQTPNGTGFVRLPADLETKLSAPSDWIAPGPAKVHAEIRLPSGEHVPLRRYFTGRLAYLAQSLPQPDPTPPPDLAIPERDGFRVTLDVRGLCTDGGELADCAKLQQLAARVLPGAESIEIMSVARNGAATSLENDAAFVAALHLQSALAGMGIAPERAPLRERSAAWAESGDPALAGLLLLRFTVGGVKPPPTPAVEEG